MAIKRVANFRSQSIARDLVRVLGIPTSEFSDQTGGAWFAMIEATADALYKKSDKVDFDAVFSAIRVSPNATHLIGVADAVSRSKFLTLNNFAPGNSVEDTSNALVALLQIPVIQTAPKAT